MVGDDFDFEEDVDGVRVGVGDREDEERNERFSHKRSGFRVGLERDCGLSRRHGKKPATSSVPLVGALLRLSISGERGAYVDGGREILPSSSRRDLSKEDQDLVR
jgi:hypothetical protein